MENYQLLVMFERVLFKPSFLLYKYVFREEMERQRAQQQQAQVVQQQSQQQQVQIQQQEMQRINVSYANIQMNTPIMLEVSTIFPNFTLLIYTKTIHTKKQP